MNDKYNIKNVLNHEKSLPGLEILPKLDQRNYPRKTLRAKFLKNKNNLNSMKNKKFLNSKKNQKPLVILQHLALLA